MERIVDRSELLSEHSTPPSSPDVGGFRRLDDFEFVKHDEAERDGEGQEAHDEEMDFMLFAPTTKADDSGEKVARIRVQTPPLTTGEPGFLIPNRDDSCYFTNELSEDVKTTFFDAAMSGEEILARSHGIWPGTSYSWKVLHVPCSKRQRAIVSSSNALFAKLCDDATTSKRRRPGKKARVKARTKIAAAKARQDQKQKAAEQKDAEEREKRTRRNREKKVKKKQREKAKKTENVPAEDGRQSQSPE